MPENRHRGQTIARLRRLMVTLQPPHFSRMDGLVRSVLQTPVLQGPQEDIVKAYKEELQKRHNRPEHHGSPAANQTAPGAGRPPVTATDSSQSEEGRTHLLLEQLKSLEEKNSSLSLENNIQRETYDRCLDQVANQVVQALLTQKDLRDECVRLRGRVMDLEQQNLALSALLHHQLRPSSDLLLQRLQSQISSLWAGDLLRDLEGAKGPAPRSLSPPTTARSHEVQLKGKAGLPVSRCLSQLGLVVPRAAYLHSSCSSSSELSLSSACSDFSSGSFTWNEGRSFGKMSSLTWDKRLSLGSSTPSNICGVLEEPVPVRRKESEILEGLRKLQRRKHRSTPSSSKISKSGDNKDCMNSNEGIYSLGIKNSSKGVSKPPYLGRVAALGVGSKKFSYDSDDADDESIHRGRGDNVPGRFYCRKLSRSISDSLCSWEGLQEVGVGGSRGLAATEYPHGYYFKEAPEKLTSFITTFLPGRTSAFTRIALLNPEGHLNLSDTDDPEELISESSDIQSRLSCSSLHVESASRRDVGLEQQCLRWEQGRTQSTDGRLRPLSLIKDCQVPRSEDRLRDVSEGEKLSAMAGPQHDVPDSKTMTDAKPSKQELPTRQKAEIGRKYTVHQSPEQPWAHQSKAASVSPSREHSVERSAVHVERQRKLMKPQSDQANKPQAHPSALKSGGSGLPGRRDSVSPLRLSKGCSTDPSNSINSGPPGEDRLPLSPPVKLSRFIKTSGGSTAQSPKALTSDLPADVPPSSSPHLITRFLDRGDRGEEPTRDKHCEPSNKHLRSPSPPSPPGCSASLLAKPNYEASPQAHKTQTSTPITVRGPPPSYHPPPVPNMQPPLPPKARDSLELDAGYGTALAPQKLVEQTGQNLQRYPAAPTKGSTSRTAVKNYLPSANSGCTPDRKAVPKSSKNVPPPYSSFQGTFVTKRGPSLNNTASPVTLPDRPRYTTEQQDSTIVSLPCSVVISTKQTEKASKTLIPMGFKAFLKSPTSNKNSFPLPGKHEKDHINSVSKETLNLNASLICASIPSAGAADSSVNTLASAADTESKHEAQSRVDEAELRRASGPDEATFCDSDKRGSQLFLRSISVSAKPHLKPALGMNGAKARSQSFSTNYTEKPNGNAQDGPGKIRTHIITNSGGSSLSRQSSLEVPSGGVLQSPLRSPGTRFSYYGGMTDVIAHNIVSPQTAKPGFSPEGVTPQAKGEGRSLPTTERSGLRNVRKPSFHPQFHASSADDASASTENSTSLLTASSPRKPDCSRSLKLQLKPPNGPPSPTSCTIEEKVMMGIEENLQKCQDQEKVSASEAKQKTGPSLANWFGLRKTKLPALGGKKADTPRIKDDKKEVKTASVLGVRQLRSEKRKEKRKSDCRENVEGQNVSPTDSKLNSIRDQCNIHVVQMASTVYMGTEPLGKELLGRTGPMGPQPSLLPAVTTATQQQQQQHLSKAKLEKVSHMTLEKGQEGLPDHVIGSSCQMRTLDSGFGTFSHLPKSRTVVGPHGTAPSDRHTPPAPPSDGRRTKGLSINGSHKAFSTTNKEEEEEEEEEGAKSKQLLSNDRTLQACTYPDSSSNTETEAEERKPEEETVALCLATPLSIMDCYRGDAFPHLVTEGQKFSHDGQSEDSLTKVLSPGKPSLSLSSSDSLKLVPTAPRSPCSTAQEGCGQRRPATSSASCSSSSSSCSSSSSSIVFPRKSRGCGGAVLSH